MHLNMSVLAVEYLTLCRLATAAEDSRAGGRGAWRGAAAAPPSPPSPEQRVRTFRTHRLSQPLASCTTDGMRSRRSKRT